MRVSELFAVGLSAALVLCAGGVQARGAHAHHAYSPRPTCSHSSNYYTNVSGHHVRRPEFSSRAPSGWSAQCSDGSYSFSEHHQGTCSHHGGVAHWR